MNECRETGKWSRRRRLGFRTPRRGKGRGRAVPRRVRCVHRKGKHQLVLHQFEQRQGVALQLDRLPPLPVPFGFSIRADDEHVDGGVEEPFEGLEATLARQPDGRLQVAPDSGEPRLVLPEVQVYLYRTRGMIHRPPKALKFACRMSAAQTFPPGGEQDRVAVSRQHERLMLLRSKTRCQSGGAD